MKMLQSFCCFESGLRASCFHRHALVLAAAGCLLLSPCAFAQGPLPPPGPPGPTMKTLDQIDAKLEKRIPISGLPLTISTPGSYYVTGDLTGSQGNPGITITTDNVTIDLNGFTLIGVSFSFAAITGTSRKNITIRNGSFRNWPSTAVGCGTCTNVRLSDLRSIGNGGGFSVGDGSEIVRCLAADSTNRGFIATSGCVISFCIATGNDDGGFQVISNNLLHDNTATNNDDHGFEVTGTGNRIDSNHAINNDNSSTPSFGFKISGTNNLVIRNSAAANNGGEFSIAAGNADGPIVLKANVATNNNPNANFDIDGP
jgi:parallel beta-helix repeat protein